MFKLIYTYFKKKLGIPQKYLEENIKKKIY